MRIATVYGIDVPNAWYRAILPMTELGRRGHEVVMVEVDNNRFAAERLTGNDVIHVYRRMEKPLLKMIAQQRDRGAAIVWDNDDDPRLIPPESPSYKQIGGYRSAAEFRLQLAMMTRAHLITTTSETLAERYRAASGGEVRVIENHLADEQCVGSGGRHEGLLIGWVAALEHRADAQRLEIADVLRRVMERLPEVRVKTIGVRLNLDSARYEHQPAVPFAQLPSVLQEFDIGIAPLADIPMNAARSNVKAKEYAAAGVPWVASRRGPYLGLGEREGGMLVGDDEWEEALVRLAGARFKRRQLRRRASAWAKSQLITRNVSEWEAAFDHAVRHAGRLAA
jgi:glycosyltransferase involved in cell wall biosynthesis